MYRAAGTKRGGRNNPARRMGYERITPSSTSSEIFSSASELVRDPLKQFESGVCDLRLVRGEFSQLANA